MSLTHVYFQMYWISAALVDINGNGDVCCLCSCKALGLLYTCACPVLEHPGLWARCWAPSSLGWVGLPLSLPFWWTSRTSPQNLWANKPAWKHRRSWRLSPNLVSAFPYHLVFSSQTVRLGQVGYCWTRWDVPFSEISCFCCLLSALSLGSSRQGALFRHGLAQRRSH